MKAKLLVAFLILFAPGVFSQGSWQALRPSWITPVTTDFTEEIKQGSVSEGYYYFFADRQIDVPSKTYYTHFAVKLFNSDGVDSESKLNFSYNPSYQKLKIHSVRIHRGTEVINKLGDARYSELQREEDLENNLYKGRMTVSLILTNVKVGDIIEFDYSVTGDNPIFNNKFSYSFYLNSYYDTRLKFCKIRYNEASRFQIHYANDSIAPQTLVRGNIRELVWDLRNVKGLRTEASMPAFFEAYNLVEISEYNNWAEVARWGAAISKVENTEVKELSPFLKSLDSIPDLKAKIMSCLRYTQDNIRYFGVEIGENSHRPKPVEKIVKEGYGDCKDKTSLFCYLLRKIGVEAFPVFVNSELRLGLRHALPSDRQFDHVITMLRLDGSNYFFDPTITYQRGSMSTTFFPDYGYGLVLTDSTRYLTRLHHKGIFDIHVTEDFRMNNMDGDCDLLVTSTYLGYDADEMRQWFTTSNTGEIRKSYLNFYEKKFGELDTAFDLAIHDDEHKNKFETTESYHLKNLWDRSGSGDEVRAEFNAHTILDMVNKINVELKTRDYPLSLDYPCFKTHEILVRLPEDWSITPGKETIENEFLVFKYSSVYFEHTVQLKYSLELKQAFVPPDKYVSFKKDLERIKNSLDYSISHNRQLSKKLNASTYNGTVVSFAILFSLVCLMIFFYCFRLFKPRGDGMVPGNIGGWMVLPFLGLILSPLRIVYTLSFDEFFKTAHWVSYTDASSPEYLPGYDVFLYYQICYDIALFFFTVFVLIQFTRKHHKLPRLMVWYYLLYFLFQSINDYFFIHFSGNMSPNAFILSLVKTAIPLAVWIPYFIISKRVKETFVV